MSGEASYLTSTVHDHEAMTTTMMMITLNRQTESGQHFVLSTVARNQTFV